MNPITVHNTQNLKKIIAEIQTTMKKVHGAIQLTPISDLNIAIYQNVALLGGITNREQNFASVAT